MLVVVSAFHHPHRRSGMVGSPTIHGFPGLPYSDPTIESGDIVPPDYRSGEIGDADETIVAIRFSENVMAAGDDFTSGVTIKFDSVVQAIVSGVRQADQTMIYYTVPIANPNAVVTWEYNSGPGVITDEASPANDLATVAAQTATNNVGEHVWFNQTGDSAHLAWL